MAPAADAACFPDKIFSHNDQAGAYNYLINFDGTAPTVGAFWQPGSRSLNNEGTYDASQWINTYAGAWYVFGFMGNGGVAGCPAGQVVVMITQDLGATSQFAVLQANEIPANSTPFYLASATMAPIPRPRVTASSRVGTDVVVDLSFDALEGAYGSFDLPGDATNVISDIVLYTAKGADPGRNVAGWTELAVVPFAGGVTTAAAVSVDCSVLGENTLLAAGLRGTGEYSSVHVSAPTAIECDPALADPDGKFDIIRERGNGQKKGKPFSER
jgi:hypothetical protein